MTPDFSDDLLNKEQQDKINRRWKIRSVILLLHVLCIGIPLLWEALDNFFRPPKVNAFRVKIGPKELSTAPVAGPPERSRPGNSSPPPEPVLPAPVEPKIPPEPKVVIPKKKPIRKPVRKKVKKPVRRKVSGRRQPVRKTREEVYRPRGGNNFNPAVPLGTRDRGQQRGKQDNRTPGGGLTEADEQFNRRAGMYLKNIWTQPPKSLLGSQLPEVTIELSIAADGRVIGKRITRSSGIPAMDQSVRNLLERLDRMPVPPRATTVEFILVTDE
ncbi:MAG: TonB C-terminal domain-containing protein [Lentisphaeria bacterium]|nr:TonB C-terminal domain-containing protein [Lentisphaeria bacterium]